MPDDDATELRNWRAITDMIRDEASVIGPEQFTDFWPDDPQAACGLRDKFADAAVGAVRQVFEKERGREAHIAPHVRGMLEQFGRDLRRTEHTQERGEG